MSLCIKPLVIPLWGSVGIHGYGLMILCGLIVFSVLVYQHLKKVIPISYDLVTSLILQGIIAGVIGGRILYVITSWHEFDSWLDIFSIWKGGLSILGVITAAALYMLYALKKQNIPLFPTLDIASIYIPLAHMFGRFGCLWAGCCFGCEHAGLFSVMYTGQTAGAPLCVPLIPSQLLSALSFALLFVILLLASKYVTKPGTLFCLYLLGAGIERFCVDFFRNDRIFGALPWFSVDQWIALCLIMVASIGLIWVYSRSKK
jgi:phosphatidylglycerol:prolipoprotein diacylglycerol transferase